MNINRRYVLEGSVLLFAGAALPAVSLSEVKPQTKSLPPFYGEIEKRTFSWFWKMVNRSNGLVPDRWPSPSAASIAAVGFALPVYAVGIERGWCTREEARDLTLTTLRFFWNAPQGSEPTGMTGQAGFFYHFLDMATGQRFRNAELSSVDTTILLMGMLFSGQYFDRDEPNEREIRRLSDAIYNRADWNFFRSDGRKAISMGWHPKRGLLSANWVGFNEGMFVNILALGSSSHPAPSDLWQQWTSTYPGFWRGTGPTRRLAFGPLFTHQYSQIFIDFRNIRDSVMRSEGFDYFENSRRETYANWAYCRANAMGWRGYSNEMWGLTACDGPGHFKLPYRGETRKFYGYTARGPAGEPGGVDDGTIAPTAALGSLPFAPEIVLPCAAALKNQPLLFDSYGFKDSFNPSFAFSGLRSEFGRIDPQLGWVASDYLGIDQGPILLQAANYRNEFVWRYMRKVPAIRLGLQRAGFTGGWLS